MELDSRHVVAEIQRTVTSFNARLLNGDSQRVYGAAGVNIRSVMTFVNGVGQMTVYLGERSVKDFDPARMGALDNTGLRQVDAQPWRKYLEVLSTKLRNCLLFALHSQLLIYMFVADSSVVLSAYKSTVVKAMQGLADNTVSKAYLVSILERINAATPMDTKNAEFEKLKAAVRTSPPVDRTRRREEFDDLKSVVPGIRTRLPEEFEAISRVNVREMERPRSFGGGILDFWRSASPEMAPVVTVETKFNEVKNLVAIVNQAPNLAKPFLTQYALAYKMHRDSADDLIRTIAGINQQFKAIMSQVSQMLAEMGANTVSRADIEAVLQRSQKMDDAVESLYALVERERDSNMNQFTKRVEDANKNLWVHMNEVVTASTVALEKRYNGEVDVTRGAVDVALRDAVGSMREADAATAAAPADARMRTQQQDMLRQQTPAAPTGAPSGPPQAPGTTAPPPTNRRGQQPSTQQNNQPPTQVPRNASSGRTPGPQNTPRGATDQTNANRSSQQPQTITGQRPQSLSATPQPMAPSSVQGSNGRGRGRNQETVPSAPSPGPTPPRARSQ